VDEVDNIFIVRDQKGPNINKVKYCCPPQWSLKIPPLSFLIKFWMMVILSIKKTPTLIHSYLLFPHGYLALLAAKITRRKASVSLIAGPVELYGFGGSPVGKYAYTKPLPKLNTIGKFNRILLKLFDNVVIAGTFTKKNLTKIGIDEKKLTIIPYIVFGNNLQPLETAKIYDLIFVGRLAKVKHIETILYVADNLMKNHSLTKLKVAIIGDGPCCKKLKNISKRLEIQENIDFLGYKEDVGLFINQSKLFIITSERETGPFTAIESMMCGVPVISSACGDTVNDIIINNYNGILIKTHDDIDGFANTIKHIINNPHLIDEYSNNAVKTAQKIKIENIASIWLDILE
jgi:glycosyltransferase involved in cell wall biosynthesis